MKTPDALNIEQAMRIPTASVDVLFETFTSASNCPAFQRGLKASARILPGITVCAVAGTARTAAIKGNNRMIFSGAANG